ncbi:MAG: hypothetical protein ACRDYC_06810 [Acidimicrobiales bacterium]
MREIVAPEPAESASRAARKPRPRRTVSTIMDRPPWAIDLTSSEEVMVSQAVRS